MCSNMLLRYVDLKCAVHFFHWYSTKWTVNMLFQVVLQGIPQCRNWVCKHAETNMKYAVPPMKHTSMDTQIRKGTLIHAHWIISGLH